MSETSPKCLQAGEALSRDHKVLVALLPISLRTVFKRMNSFLEIARVLYGEMACAIARQDSVAAIFAVLVGFISVDDTILAANVRFTETDLAAASIRLLTCVAPLPVNMSLPSSSDSMNFRSIFMVLRVRSDHVYDSVAGTNVVNCIVFAVPRISKSC